MVLCVSVSFQFPSSLCGTQRAVSPSVSQTPSCPSRLAVPVISESHCQTCSDAWDPVLNREPAPLELGLPRPRGTSRAWLARQHCGVAWEAASACPTPAAALPGAQLSPRPGPVCLSVRPRRDTRSFLGKAGMKREAMVGVETSVPTTAGITGIKENPASA